MVLVGDMGTSCARLGRSGGDRPTYCVHAALGVPATASVAIGEDEELHHTYGGGGSGGGAGGGLGASSVLSPGASMRSSPVKSAIKSAAKSPGKPAGGTSSRPPLRHPPPPPPLPAAAAAAPHHSLAPPRHYRVLPESLSKRTITVLDAARQWSFPEDDESGGGGDGGATLHVHEHEHETHERLVAAGRGMAYPFNQKTASYNSETLEQVSGREHRRRQTRTRTRSNATRIGRLATQIIRQAGSFSAREPTTKPTFIAPARRPADPPTLQPATSTSRRISSGTMPSRTRSLARTPLSSLTQGQARGHRWPG